MRHNKAVNHLGRKSGHRKALLSNMACSLIMHKRINTTVAKAKALKTYVEPLITKCKEDTTHNRRVVFSYLKSKEAVTELFRTIAPKVADRYTRVLHTGFRQGDAAEMALIELVDFNEAALASASKTAKKTTRRGRSGKKAEAAAAAEAPKAAETAPAAPAAEETKAEPAAEAAPAEEAAAPAAEEPKAE